MLGATCERILADERGHVAFHRATLGREFAEMAEVRGRARRLARALRRPIVLPELAEA